MRRLLIALWLLCASAQAGPFLGFALSERADKLTIDTRYGTMTAPRTEPEQEGFARPRRTPDAAQMGWLATTSNCCTSYPLPTVLVVWRAGQPVRRFAGELTIWDWRFWADDTEVIYRQSAPHGISSVIYARRRLSDGKVLATFTCWPDEDGPPLADGSVGFIYDAPVPAWVWPIASECPERSD